MAIKTHPICPTCQSDLTGRTELPRFCGESPDPVTNDDVFNLHEETQVLVCSLGALAQAGPLAVAQYAEQTQSADPDWLDDLRPLAEELAGETTRRLVLLYTAGLLWQERAEAARKEG